MSETTPSETGLFGLGSAAIEPLAESTPRQIIALAWELYEGSLPVANASPITLALYPETQKAVDGARADANAALIAIGYNCHKLGISPLIGPGGFGDENPTVH